MRGLVKLTLVSLTSDPLQWLRERWAGKWTWNLNKHIKEPEERDEGSEWWGICLAV